MLKREEIRGWAAFLNAALAVGNLVVIFGVLGPEVVAHPGKIAALVVTWPAPLLWLEGFKVLAAAANLVLITLFYQRLQAVAARTVTLATASGGLSVLLLLLAGLIGAIAILQGGYSLGVTLVPTGVTYTGMNHFVNRLGLTALLCNGLWLLLVGWQTRKTGQLPPGLCALTMVVGMANMLAFVVPPSALLGLVLGLGWSLWLGSILLRRALS